MAEIRPCTALQLACQDQAALWDSPVSFIPFFSSSSSSRMHGKGSQGNHPEGRGGMHDRVYTSSIFNIVRVHSVEPRREEETQLASAQNTVRVILSPLKDKTNPMAQSASTAQETKKHSKSRSEQNTKCYPELELWITADCRFDSIAFLSIAIFRALMSTVILPNTYKWILLCFSDQFLQSASITGLTKCKHHK